MLNAGVLTFREFAMHEPLPLATIQQAVLEFLQGRDDAVVIGAQAVNAYVPEPRMTQDIDLLSDRSAALADEMRDFLRGRFHIAVRVRRLGGGKGHRLFQVRKAGNRHLVDIRPVETLPAAQRIEGVLVIAPPELVAHKVMAYHDRRGQPKSGTDWRDLAMLLLKFPALKRPRGPVLDCLRAAGADPATLATWQELVAQQLRPEDGDTGF
ncbi:MAG TPA: nucleotidyl transferase AbiEii/AbiGii toxin family protein [Planctomycetota bacterium]|nr:nucleotidyl transferase AbiEii/AbiGii toxin family protein [Planctomycetota bacterium]